MNIIKNIVTRNDRVYGHNNKKKYITIHETDNTDKGANATAHGKLQARGNPREASWHYSVDDEKIVQSFEHSAQCWHSGKGRDKGNLNSIAIEICVNSDGDFKKAVENTIKLVKHIMKQENISIENVVQHNKWSGKNCPHYLRNGEKGINWSDFITSVKSNEGTNTKPPKKESKPKKQGKKNDKQQLAVDGYWGPATTRALQRYFGTIEDGVISGQPSNYSTRNIPSAEIGKGGSNLIEAMQKWAGTTADRVITNPSQLIGFLQKRYGTVYDRKISKPSLVVKEIQKRLNEGKL